MCITIYSPIMYHIMDLPISHRVNDKVYEESRKRFISELTNYHVVAYLIEVSHRKYEL